MQWLARNGLDPLLFHGITCTLLLEAGMPFSDRHDRFNGITFALLDCEIPTGMALLPFTNGFEFGASKVRLPSSQFFQERFIKLWDVQLQFTSPLPETREGWPLPFPTALGCVDRTHGEMILCGLRDCVDHKCSLLDTSCHDEAVKRPRRTWRKLQGLVNALRLNQMEVGQADRPPSTRILALHWTNPKDLAASDCCREGSDPGRWLTDSCDPRSGIWMLRPGLPVPAADWKPTVLHALKARLLNELLNQTAVPAHRVLRGNVSTKMPDGFWFSCSAAEVPHMTDQGTWRHCLMWRITIHQLRSLPDQTTPQGIWQAGTLHILTRAPRTQGGSGRIIFAPPATDFGETLVLVLEYAGPAICAYTTLRAKAAQLGCPVRAALDLTELPEDVAPPTNTLRAVFYDGFEEDLPSSLKIIDEEQRSILRAMASSDASVHVINALAGCGKSTLLQCLIALYASLHAVLDVQVAAQECIMITLRTRTLRHEFLQSLLVRNVLRPHQVIFGGRLPEELCDTGLFDDDVAHFERIILAVPAVTEALRQCETLRARLESQHAVCLAAHADGSWIAVGEVTELKSAAKDALRALWAFHEAHYGAEEAAITGICVVMVTTDVGLKLLGKTASPNSPAARVLKKKRSTALIMDEIQRCPSETYLALASHHPTVVAVGDRGQELHPLVSMPRRGPLQVQTFASRARPTFAAELLLSRAAAAPGASDVAAVYHLTQTKRFGNPLARYLARVHPALCSSLKADESLRKLTPVSHVWYEAPCQNWYNLGYFLGSARKRQFQAHDDAWQLSAAVWNDGLFTVLAASILLQLQDEVISRRAEQKGFGADELVVVVCAAIRRVVGPFQLVMNALLESDEVRARFDLGDLQPRHVQVRLPGELTGPSACYTYVLHHPRYRADSQAQWREADLQHHGQQTVDELNYIMESRAEKGLFVFLHRHDQLVPKDSGWRDIQARESVEKDRQLVTRYDTDCNQPERAPIGFSPTSWREAVKMAETQVRYLRQHSHDITQATGLLGEGDGETSLVLQDTLRSLVSGQQEFVLQDERSAKRRGEERNEGPIPLADFGRRAWPRPPVQVFSEDVGPAVMRHMMVELAWRLVDHVAVNIEGKTLCQIAVPLLDPLPGYASPNYGTTASWAAPGAPLLQGFVLCVWAVYASQQNPPAQRTYTMMSVHHKASIQESDEGVTWWARACNTDREAIILLDSDDAELLLQDVHKYRRPHKPKAPPLYCYIGCGVDRQPQCILGLVVRCRDPGLTAAVATTCRILGLNFPGNSPVQVTTDLIATPEEPWAQGVLTNLQGRMSSMWVPWSNYVAQPHRMLDALMAVVANTEPPNFQAVPDVAAAALRVLDVVVIPDEDVPDWGGSSDDEVVVEPEPVPPANMPRPPPSARWIRLGVDLGGVLLPKFPGRSLAKVRSVADVGALVEGAQEWLSEAATHIGPENIYVISYVGSRRLRVLFGEFLVGVFNRVGIPPGNIIFTDAKTGPSGKMVPFLCNSLTHFVDDQIDVLVDIRAGCWERCRNTSPTLVLLPTAWADGSSSDYNRVSADAAASNAGWEIPWNIFPTQSLVDVHPWEWQ